MHCECKLVGIEHSVMVQVRQFPDFAEDGVRQSRLDELHLGGGSTDLAIDRAEPLKCLVVLVPISRHYPLVRMVAAPVDTLTLANAKWTLIVAVKCSALQTTASGVTQCVCDLISIIISLLLTNTSNAFGFCLTGLFPPRSLRVMPIPHRSNKERPAAKYSTRQMHFLFT